MGVAGFVLKRREAQLHHLLISGMWMPQWESTQNLIVTNLLKSRLQGVLGIIILPPPITPL
jgi:hypothetical protein